MTALDQSGNTATSYSGTVHFSSSDALADLSADATLTNGTGIFLAALGNAGTQTLTATDTQKPGITGSGTVTVGAASAVLFTISATADITAGKAFDIVVTARDQFNNLATAYAGTVHFSSSDSLAGLPADATLTAGSGTFPITLDTAGGQTIGTADTLASIAGNATITVNAAAVKTLGVTAPTAVAAGSGLNVTVTAEDNFGNIVTGYTGTVQLTTSDGAATLPTNRTLTGGIGIFTITLKTAGSQTLTATDTLASNPSGTATVNVSAAAATHFVVSIPTTPPRAVLCLSSLRPRTASTTSPPVTPALSTSAPATARARCPPIMRSPLAPAATTASLSSARS